MSFLRCERKVRCRPSDSGVTDAGESSLHLAIVNNDVDMVRRLIRCGADVNRAASGRFFLPEDQKKQLDGVTDYNGQRTTCTLNCGPGRRAMTIFLLSLISCQLLRYMRLLYDLRICVCIYLYYCTSCIIH